MKNTRRQFIKLASGLLVPAAAVGIPGILSAAVAPRLIFSGRNTATVPVLPPGYLVSEDFEGTGTPSGWTVDTSAGGTIDFDDTTAPSPLVGAQSCRLAPTSTAQIWAQSPAFADQSEFEMYCVLHIVGAGVGGNSSSSGLLTIMSGANAMGTLRYDSAGTRFTVNCGSSTVNGSSGSHYGNTYHVWLRYVAGTGANAVLEFRLSSDATRPAGHTVRTLVGTSTGDATSIRLITPRRNHAPVVYDKVRVNPSVGSDPA